MTTENTKLRTLLDAMEAQLNQGFERLESCRQTLGDETFNEAIELARSDLMYSDDEQQEPGPEFEADYSPDWATPGVENELEAMFDHHANSDWTNSEDFS